MSDGGCSSSGNCCAIFLSTRISVAKIETICLIKTTTWLWWYEYEFCMEKKIILSIGWSLKIAFNQCTYINCHSLFTAKLFKVKQSNHVSRVIRKLITVLLWINNKVTTNNHNSFETKKILKDRHHEDIRTNQQQQPPQHQLKVFSK